MSSMDVGTLAALLPRVTACVLIIAVAAWLAYLLQPALTACLSPKYAPYDWVKGRRGILNFLTLAHECIFDAGGLFSAAYEKLRRTTKELFVMPLPHSNTGFLLLMPQELINEYARQPESVISFYKYVNEVMHPKYSMFGENILSNNTQKPIVYRELFQKLADKMEMLNEEVVGGINDVLLSQVDGKGEVRVNMWDTATKILSRASNRVIVGHPLCRNQAYLDATVHYAVNMFSLAIYMRFIPSFLRPLFAPLLGRPLARDRDIVAKHALPIIEERMRLLEKAEENGVEPNLPNDLLSAAIKVARKDPNRALEYTPGVLVNRIMAFNFLQSYSNTLTLTNIIYDLISLPEEQFKETVDDLRNEIRSQLQQQPGWTHEFVNSLDVMDSLIRESLRANPVGDVGIERTIVQRDGFTFSNGVHVPRGATLAAPLRMIQQDPKNFPGGFNPKRSLLDPAKPKVTTIGPEFLNFGLGRPACPGRWFTANLQKLVLSHILLHFDLVRVEKRPAGVRKATLVEPCGRVTTTLKKREPVELQGLS